MTGILPWVSGDSHNTDRDRDAIAGPRNSKLRQGSPVYDDAPVFALVLSKSQDGRHHGCSGAKLRFMGCHRGERLDLGLAPPRSFKDCPRNYCQRRSFRLGDRRGLARGQSVSPLSRGSRVVLCARDIPSLDSLRSFLNRRGFPFSGREKLRHRWAYSLKFESVL